jgi:hypothetical protein
MKAQLILLLVEKACRIWLMYNLVLVCFLKVLVIASHYRSIWNKRDACTMKVLVFFNLGFGYSGTLS